MDVKTKARKVSKSKYKKESKSKYKKENYLLGYGSLINKISRNLTMKKSKNKRRKQKIIPVILSKNAKYKRVWKCLRNYKNSNKNYSFLSIQKSINPTNINGVLFQIDGSIGELDKREKNYNRVLVSEKHIKSFDKNKSIKMPNANIYTYVSKKNQKKQSTKCPIVKKYLDIVQEGCDYYGKDFYDYFNKTTENPKYIFKNDKIYTNCTQPK